MKTQAPLHRSTPFPNATEEVPSVLRQPAGRYRAAIDVCPAAACRACPPLRLRRHLPIARLLAFGAWGMLLAGCGKAPGPSVPAQTTSLVAEARDAVAKGDVLGAERLYRRAIEGTRGIEEASIIRQELALALLSAAAAADSPAAVRSQAINAAEQALRATPECSEIQLGLARQFVTAGQFASARDHLLGSLEDLEKGSAEHVSSAILLARSWEGTGHADEALAIVAPLVGFDPDSRRIDTSVKAPEGTPTTEAFVVLEKILRTQRNDVATANEVMAHCAERNPSDPLAWTETARWLDSIGDAAGARDAVAHAIGLAPTDPIVLRAEVDRALKDADGEKAASALARLREVSPRSTNTFQLAARYVTAHGTATEAIDLVTDWLGRLGRRPERQVLQVAKLAFGVRITPDETQTVSAHLDAIRDRLGALLPFAQLLEARVLMQDRRWHSAAKRLLEARALIPQPTRNSVCLLLARCHAELGSFDEELADCRQVDRSIDGAQAVRADSIALSALARLGWRGALRSDSASLLRAIDGTKALPEADIDSAIAPLVAAQIAQAPDQRDWDPVRGLTARRLASSEKAADKLVIPRAMLLEASGDIEGAIASLRQAAGTAADRADVTAARIRITARHRGVEEALLFESEHRQRKADSSPILIALVAAVASDAPRDETGWIDEYTARAEAIEAHGDAAEALIAIAALALRADAWDRARHALTAAAARLPDDPRAPLALASAAALRGDVATAGAAAEDVAGIDGPSAPTSRLAAAAALVAKAIASPADAAAPLGEARALLVEAATDRPGWTDIPKLRAVVETLARNNAAAIPLLEEARGLGPPDGDLERELVGLLVAEGRFAEADRIRGTVACPSFPGPVRARIDEDLRLGFIDACIDRSLRTCPPETATAEELVWMSRLLAKGGRLTESRSTLDRAVSIAADRPEPWLWLVASHVAASEQNEGEEILGRALAAAPAEGRTLLAARGASILGRLEDAGRDFLVAALADNTRIDAAGHAVDFFLRQGKSKEAESMLHRLLDDGPGASSRRRCSRTARPRPRHGMGYQTTRDPGERRSRRGHRSPLIAARGSFPPRVLTFDDGGLVGSCVQEVTARARVCTFAKSTLPAHYPHRCHDPRSSRRFFWHRRCHWVGVCRPSAPAGLLDGRPTGHRLRPRSAQAGIDPPRRELPQAHSGGSRSPIGRQWPHRCHDRLLPRARDRRCHCLRSDAPR
jgi:tetratricopeptide (TPR) repeat protein